MVYSVEMLHETAIIIAGGGGGAGGNWIETGAVFEQVGGLMERLV